MPGWTLEGLKSALIRAGVDNGRWAIAYSKVDLAPANECYCLYDDGALWTVSYIERGKWNLIAQFDSKFEAMRYFWWSLTEAPTPFD
ncbi:hypothetical protein ACFFF7_01980 [Novosphingobium aquiterrae]|uniref:Uncharacterized protein n=1 Tax=Novosphingobium aquiterrae TaxID=624388 RepID=A0ABV6PEC0_9SPHN